MKKLSFSLLVLFLTSCVLAVEDDMNREAVLAIKGLVTQPNPYGDLPPGSLSQADNVVIRRKDVLEPLPLPINYSAGIPTDGTKPLKMWSGDTRMLVVNGTTVTPNILRWTHPSGATDYTTLAYGTSTRGFVFNAGKTHMARSRGRYFVTENLSPVVFDAENGTPRMAGLPPPGAIRIGMSNAGSVVTNLKYTAYKAHFKRDQSDGYTVIGAVSAPVASRNNSGADRNPTVTISWDETTWPLVAGDKVVLYRVLQQATFDELGDDYGQAQEVVLSATNITNGFVIIEDSCLEETLGAALYVNEFQEGATKTNWMPPPATDVRTFKGATFYVAKSGWHTLDVQIKGAFGDLSTLAERTYGIGTRNYTGNITSGNNTVTNVPAIVGLAVGQRVKTPTYFTDGTTVSSISGAGPYSVVMSTNAVNTAVGTSFATRDVFIVNSTTVEATVALPEDIAASTAVVAFPRFLLENFGPTITGADYLLTAPVSGAGSFTVKATNGQNYSPTLSFTVATTSTNDPRTNRVYFSKIQQPEAVPPLNYLDVGAGKIMKLWESQNALYVFCTDGLYRITGDGDDWRDDLIDPSVLLLSANAVDSLDNIIYAWTTQGVVALAGDATTSISENIQDDLRAAWYAHKAYTQEPANEIWGIQLVADSFRKEIWLSTFATGSLSAAYDGAYIFNATTGAITRMTSTVTTPYSLAYSPFLLSLVYGIADLLLQPNRTDLGCNAVVNFNPVFAGETGDLKQWNSVSLSFESVNNVQFYPRFDGTNVVNYLLSATSGQNLQVPVPRRAALSKQLKFGFDAIQNPLDPTAGPGWKLYAVSARFRGASETIKR